MIRRVLRTVTRDHIPVVKKEEITIVTTENPDSGFLLAKKILYEIVDENTVLFLSGGSQKTLYKMLADERKIRPGAVAIVDERYGPPSHAISNQKLVEDTGLVTHLQSENVSFYPVLTGLKREETAQAYEQTVKNLVLKFPNRIAILGLGVDGHIAGIAPNRADFVNPIFADTTSFVAQFADPKPMSREGDPSPPNGFGQRVTMTFAGLSQMDLLLLIAFGSNKQEAFAKLFSQGSREDVPSRFFKEPGVCEKTLFITDQSSFGVL